MGDDYTIADIATFPWVRNLIGFMARAIWSASAIFRTLPARWRRFVARSCRGGRAVIRRAASRRLPAGREQCRVVA